MTTAAAPRPAPRAAAARVLVVEDDLALLRALRINLRARGYAATTSGSGRDALREASHRPPDAVILDLGLPDIDGLAVIRGLRDRSSVPIIVLSGRAGSSDKIGALDAGADDYVTKPFAMEELLARLRAALRREAALPRASRIRIGSREVDLVARTVWRADPAPEVSQGPSGPTAGPDPQRLTPTEWRLLEILLRHQGQLVPSRHLLFHVWGPGFEDSPHYLRYHMAGLRRKLEVDPSRPRHLLTEPGIGYRLQL